MTKVTDRSVAEDLRAVLPLMPDLSGMMHRLNDVRTLLQGEEGALPDPDKLTIDRITIESTDGVAIPALLYRPATAPGPRPALLNIHGGGYVAGTALRDDPTMRQMALDLGCVVLSIDYRLSPEFPYPAPLNDCDTALSWLAANAAELSVDPKRIAVRGVSAGGGLAAALALRDRSRGAAAIRHLLLIYPMLDDRTRDHPVAGRYVWTPPLNAFGWSSYLGSISQAPPPDAVPARANDLSGFAPTTIAIGSIDLFVDEALDFAKALIRSDVPTELHVYPGAFHGFNLVPDARASIAFERDCRAALSYAFRLKDDLA